MEIDELEGTLSKKPQAAMARTAFVAEAEYSFH